MGPSLAAARRRSGRRGAASRLGPGRPPARAGARPRPWIGGSDCGTCPRISASPCPSLRIRVSASPHFAVSALVSPYFSVYGFTFPLTSESANLRISASPHLRIPGSNHGARAGGRAALPRRRGTPRRPGDAALDQPRVRVPPDLASESRKGPPVRICSRELECPARGTRPGLAGSRGGTGRGSLKMSQQKWRGKSGPRQQKWRGRTLAG